MKRMTAILLAALLLCTGTALAAQWREGTGPSQPYQGAPEIDLSQQMGYMMFFPSEQMPVENECERLYIYLPREDVHVGEGTFYLCTDRGEVWETEMTDPDAVIERPINESELDGLLWGGGTCFEIRLSRSLKLGETYFVNLTGGSIVSEDGVQSPQIGGTDQWRFTLAGDYGVSEMAYLRAEGDETVEVESPQPGDEIRFDLVLGGDAAWALLYEYNDSADFLETMFQESCEVTGQVTGDQLVWGVLFMDAEGNELHRTEFW